MQPRKENEMAIYMISYDLRKVRNYDKLISQLREWGCISPLKSLWFGNLRGTSGNIRDALKAHIDADDGLMVCLVQPTWDWATFKVNEDAAAWFKANLGG